MTQTEAVVSGRPAEGTVFRVMLRMQIHPGMEREFERVWHDTSGVIGGNPANIGQWLLRSAEEESVYYIMSDWVDEPSFRAFEGTAEHVEHRVKLHPYRSNGTMTAMNVIYALCR
ncbi:antibiotic biosynthesis monooxygenase family protein [Spongiactinospora sp. TRM90649]|uniref:antibiotic biosynthesis monooxygenase family protein n=1 Tax=Spongiactinospora sp. TRM90649 TaxID=3031114 RepID=UPI0023F98FF6|nr:antibiotic biosynthesis monooxygenase family protein [Spongiactinospora sp. TRM90649]MDF5753658.1 antibiotic biosynthesis monooxygenase [Spongiactinospora sp. TRM90649]